MDRQAHQAFRPDDVLGTLNPYERKNAPETIYYLGNLGLLQSGSRVSVVGSRKVSEMGAKRAEFLARKLTQNKITVVSGLAEGVDAIAHQTAINEGGRTIAVLGSSLDNPYPKTNKELFEEIAKYHLVVSQFPFQSPVQPKNFPIRNRTMALVSHATIIIEATEKSGTKHQGWEALRLGRLLYILENVINDESLTWPREMVKYGAQVLKNENLQEVIDELACVHSTGQDCFDF